MATLWLWARLCFERRNQTQRSHTTGQLTCDQHRLVELGMEGRLVVAKGSSPGAQTYRGFFERTRPEALALELVTDQEVETFLMLFDDPEFNCTLPIMMSAWG